VPGLRLRHQRSYVAKTLTHAAHDAPDRRFDKDRQDFTIYSGDWAMGRIYEQRGGPDSMLWFWLLQEMP
jgi:hypothetical protein